jgi:hypothetical protein
MKAINRIGAISPFPSRPRCRPSSSAVFRVADTSKPPAGRKDEEDAEMAINR